MIRHLFRCRQPLDAYFRQRTHNFSHFRRLHSSQKANQDYYNTLGVRKDATQREIKSAYYQLSKKYHPDAAGKDATAAAKFIEISEAYDCLRDPQKRRAYDNQVSGGGGRYPGDYSQDPFGAYQQAFRQSYQRQGANPFHNRQFTQAEYERIWNHFNRMRNERETYDQRMEYERQKLWMEFARRRAERWQAFHQRYPNGPPGSIKWEFSWGSNNNDPQQQERRVYQGRELLRRIVIVYFVCFLIVSFVQVFYYAIGANPKREFKSAEAVDNAKIEAIMNKMPASPMDYMYRQPVEREEDTGSVPSEKYSYYPGQEVTSRDEHGSSFSTYVTRP